MSREFTYSLLQGYDKTYIVTTIIDGEEKSFECVVANDDSELAEILEVAITNLETSTYE